MKKLKWFILILVIVLSSVFMFLYFERNSTPDDTHAGGTTETKEQANPAESASTGRKKTDPREREKRKKLQSITDINEKINYLVDNMTMEEKVGQLMMVGFPGTSPDETVNDLILNKNIGGIIYFDRNMTKPKQVAQLTNELQQLAKTHWHELPIMIAVDQEGGSILRMREEVSPIPSPQKLGKIATPDETYEVSKINGTELSSMGIHINFAPVLDLSETDTRSFGKDPEKTFLYGQKTIAGLNDASVTGTIKHFPGNGRSEIDPHEDTSSVRAKRDELENSDIHPFKEMIRTVDNNNFFVMVTHIKYPAYDAEKPASLSRKIIQDLLRSKLGFNGIVVTDDLEMGAVNKYYTYKDMGKDALLAGADLLLVCHEHVHQLEVYNGVLEAVKNGEITEERIDESVRRILTYKLTQIEETETDLEEADRIVKSDEHVNYINNLN